MTKVIYYSATEAAFLFSDVHGPKFLDDGGEVISHRFQPDAVEVSAEDYAALMEAQDNGKWIRPDENGYPQIVEPSEG